MELGEGSTAQSTSFEFVEDGFAPGLWDMLQDIEANCGVEGAVGERKRSAVGDGVPIASALDSIHDIHLTAALHGNNYVGDRTTGRDLDIEEEAKNAPEEVSANTKLGKRHCNALIMFKRTAWLDSALE